MILICYGNRQTTQEQKQEQQEQEQQVAAVGAVVAVAAAGAGSRLSTDGCKQSERIATIRIILMSSPTEGGR